MSGTALDSIGATGGMTGSFMGTLLAPSARMEGGRGQECESDHRPTGEARRGGRGTDGQGGASARQIQAAIMRDNRAPTPRAVLEALREVGHRHTGVS
jgi:hypothetical protein